MAIDDLANRVHDCDLLLDQNLHPNPQTYAGLVPSRCKVLLGPEYALLRDEFSKTDRAQKIRNEIERVLIFFGGSDLSNQTSKAIKAIASLKKENLKVDIVIGAANAHQDQIKELVKDHGYHLHQQINNMAELMSKADLAIGAGGSTTWERLYMGLPTVVIAIAENQIKIAQECNRQGLVKYLGWHEEVSEDDLSQSLREILYKREAYQELQERVTKFSTSIGSKIDSIINRIVGE